MQWKCIDRSNGKSNLDLRTAACSGILSFNAANFGVDQLPFVEEPTTSFECRSRGCGILCHVGTTAVHTAGAFRVLQQYNMCTTTYFSAVHL